LINLKNLSATFEIGEGNCPHFPPGYVPGFTLCLELCFGGINPRGDGTAYQQTSISKTVLPNHTRWDIGLLDAQQ